MRRSFTATVCSPAFLVVPASDSRCTELLLWPAAGTGVETPPPGPDPVVLDGTGWCLLAAAALRGHPATLLLLRAGTTLATTGERAGADPGTPAPEGPGVQGLETGRPGFPGVTHTVGQGLGELALGASAEHPSEHAGGAHERLRLFELAEELVHLLGRGPASPSDPGTSRAVDDPRFPPLAR